MQNKTKQIKKGEKVKKTSYNTTQIPFRQKSKTHKFYRVRCSQINSREKKNIINIKTRYKVEQKNSNNKTVYSSTVSLFLLKTTTTNKKIKRS